MRVRRRISAEINGSVEFGLIPQEHWYQPDWIDEDKASASRAEMVASNVIYGGASRSDTPVTHVADSFRANRQCIVRSLRRRSERAMLTSCADIATCAGSILV